MGTDATNANTEEMQEMLVQAARQHQAGRFEAAEPAYRQILELDPNQPDAHHLLGLALSQRGEQHEALTHIERAIELRHNCPEYHNSLGVVLALLDRMDAAIECYREALHQRTDYVEPRYNLAGLLHRSGRSEEAAEQYRAVLVIRPDDAAAHNNLGCVLRDSAALDEAEVQFREALRIDPNYQNAAKNLAAMAATAKASSPADMAWIPPVIITAPTERNGVTLVQRLLNSTRQIVVYGEDSLFFRAMPQLFFEKLSHHEHLGQTGAATRKRFKEETTEFWTSGLWPDLEKYARAVGECFNRVINMYRESAQDMGFSRWGMKQPMTEIDEFGRIRKLIPTAKMVFIYRNLFDVARSAKARRFARGPQQMAELARHWQDNLLSVLRERPAETLIIRYEDLLANPEDIIGQLERFTDLSGIDPTVLQRRFNTFAGDPQRGHSPTEYIEPEALDDAEVGALRQTAADALAFTGYENSK